MAVRRKRTETPTAHEPASKRQRTSSRTNRKKGIEPEAQGETKPVVVIKTEYQQAEDKANVKVTDKLVVKHPDDKENMSDPEDENDGMSAYERQRQKNLLDNARFLAQLGIQEARESLVMLTGGKKKPTARGLREKKEKEILPRRKSLRIAHMDPAGEPLPYVPPELVISEEDPPRKPSGPLEMREYLNNVEDKDVIEAFLTSLPKLKEPKQTAKVAVDSSSCQKSMAKLTMTETRVAKLVPTRIFSVAIHPTEDKVLACAGDKWGRIALWDVESEAGQNGVFCFEPHVKPVNHLSFNPDDPHRLFSCSYDGTVRSASLQKAVFDEVYATDDSRDIRIMSFDWLSPHSIIASQSNGDVAVVDIRTPGADAEHVYYVHDRPVRSTSVHPGDSNYFSTSSIDATVAIWDLRKMLKTKKSSSIAELPHGKSVTSAYFSPITGKYLLTTSIDNYLRVYDTQNCSSKVPVKQKIRHNNHTGRWLTGFRASWHPRSEDLFVVGSMERPRQIELFSAESGEIVKKFRDEDHLGSVCSLNAIHPTRHIIVGGNSSGRVHVFM